MSSATPSVSHAIPDPAPVTAAGPDARRRLLPVDVVRGAVMVLMALDHARVYSGIPAGGPDPGVFFTRWVTHFCAPAFIFLAGTSAFLRGERMESRAALSRHLLLRGLGLVLLELTAMRLFWTFNLDVRHSLLGVLWCIGWCMVAMAALVHLPTAALGGLGVAVIALHNAIPQGFGPVEGSAWTWLWQVLYTGGPVQVGAGGPHLFVLYTLVPWVGVMAAGYAFGAVLRMPRERRRLACLRVGVAAVAAFLALRAFDLYGDPRPWNADGAAQAQPPAALRFLNTTKYPASLLFLLMTLGPVLALLPWLERARGRVVEVLAVFGRVPLFYYVLHIPLIHLAACMVSLIRHGEVVPWLFANHPVMVPRAPDGYTWSLGLLYAVTIGVVALLYPLCRRQGPRVSGP